jgi:hypothetical protein
MGIPTVFEGCDGRILAPSVGRFNMGQIVRSFRGPGQPTGE